MGIMATAVVTLTLLVSCAYARELLASAPEVECLVGAAGDKFCQSTTGGNSYTDATSGYYTACVPIAPAYPNMGYNATAGACGTALTGPSPGSGSTVALNYNFVNFTYSPPDSQWGGAAQKAFVAKEQCDNGASNSAIKCSNTYQKATTTTSTTTFTQQLALEADFTFKVGGCALCPAEADTTFKVTASAGFQEQYSNSSTTTFTSSLEADVPPGNCTWEIFSVNYLNNFAVDFEANVEATCMQAGALPTATNSFFNYPCTDFEGYLSGNKDFTATIVRVDPYTGSPKQKAYIALSGTTTISFGTTVNKAACDCNDQACIAKNSAAALGANSVSKVSVNAAALPNGAPSASVGTAQPLSSTQSTCTDCITNTSGGSGSTGGTGSTGASAQAPAPVGSVG